MAGALWKKGSGVYCGVLVRTSVFGPSGQSGAQVGTCTACGVAPDIRLGGRGPDSCRPVVSGDSPAPVTSGVSRVVPRLMESATVVLSSIL